MGDGCRERGADDEEDDTARPPRPIETGELDEDVGHGGRAVAHVREDGEEEDPEREVEGQPVTRRGPAPDEMAQDHQGQDAVVQEPARLPVAKPAGNVPAQAAEELTYG